ncbi:uncharacterized protein PAC_14384 [Phialocephala subalpina]|uniref:F-box domain-containing protein n=1 Tax=Phialocephala subalpina TaxID=576137 RepID=A0A1L7XHQ1_9HELO|nr:uncharacterized protein PAC_14384 [Phialocephala subalpina]
MTRIQISRRKATTPAANDLPRSRATSVVSGESTSPIQSQGFFAKGMNKVKKGVKKPLTLFFKAEQVDAVFKRVRASTSASTTIKVEDNEAQGHQKTEVDGDITASSSDSDDLGSASTSERDTLESIPSSPLSANSSIKEEIEHITEKNIERDTTPPPSEKALGKRKAELVSKGDDVEYTTESLEQASKKQKIENVSGSDNENDQVEFDTPPPKKTTNNKRKVEFVSEANDAGHIASSPERTAKKQKVEDVDEYIIGHDKGEAAAASEHKEREQREVTPPPSEKALGKRMVEEVIDPVSQGGATDPVTQEEVNDIIDEEEDHEVTPEPSENILFKRKEELAVVTFTTRKGKNLKEAVLERVTYFNSPRGEQKSNSYLTKLPAVLQKEIFKNLGPATQRILGATCRGLYDVYKNNYYETAIAVSWSEDKFYSHRNPNKSTPYIEIIQDWILPSYVRTFAQTKDLKNNTLDERENLKDIYFEEVRELLNQEIEAKKKAIERAKKREAIAAAIAKQRAEADARREKDRLKRAAAKAKRDKKAALGVKDAKVTKKAKGGKSRKGGKLIMDTKGFKAVEEQFAMKAEVAVGASVEHLVIEKCEDMNVVGTAMIENTKGVEAVENIASSSKDIVEMEEEEKVKEVNSVENIASSSKDVMVIKQEEKVKEVVRGPKVWENPKHTARVKSWIGFLKL